MGKKRKARGNPLGELVEEEARPDAQTKYDVNEEFADSEDEFFAGRDKILLEEGPAKKRRRKLEEEGKFARNLVQLDNANANAFFQNNSYNPPMKKF